MVPEDLSPQIKQMARVYENITDPREKIRKIKDDLTLNYSYNVETGEIPQNDNFLDNFQ